MWDDRFFEFSLVRKREDDGVDRLTLFYAAVKSELTKDKPLFCLFCDCLEYDREGDGEVEMAAAFGEFAWGEVDSDPFWREFVVV